MDPNYFHTGGLPRAYTEQLWIEQRLSMIHYLSDEYENYQRRRTSPGKSYYVDRHKVIEQFIHPMKIIRNFGARGVGLLYFAQLSWFDLFHRSDPSLHTFNTPQTHQPHNLGLYFHPRHQGGLDVGPHPISTTLLRTPTSTLPSISQNQGQPNLEFL